MRLSSRWRDGWLMDSEGIDGLEDYALPESVVKSSMSCDSPMTTGGDPRVWRGGWKLVWPLLRSLSRHFHVISLGCRR